MCQNIANLFMWVESIEWIPLQVSWRVLAY
jgi:hypothetical protein